LAVFDNILKGILTKNGYGPSPPTIDNSDY